MRRFTILAMFVAMVLNVSAQYKMQVWMNGSALNLPVAVVDSITFLDETPDCPDTPVPSPDPNPDPSTANGIGVFSVAEGKTVSFAPGNLQFNAAEGSHLRADGTAAKGTWRFAENQWDYVGDANENIAEDYDGWIDLFGWGTSGYDNTAKDPYAIFYQPWSKSTASISNIKIDSTLNCDAYDITGDCVWEYTYGNSSYNNYGYGPSTNMRHDGLYGTSANYDWGMFNAISNGGNEAGLWRTLTKAEWDYLLNTRKNAQYLRSQATVNGVYGFVLLPDDFKKPADMTWSYQANNWSTNTYTIEQWAVLEATGAVFLPAAGCRDGSVVGRVQFEGYYWSTTEYTNYIAYHLSFHSGNTLTIHDSRDCGQSVRLVKEIVDEPSIPDEPNKPEEHNGHEYVDLGLPSGLKWATCNVGANSPEKFGDYFAWGETEPKDYYDWSTYKWCNGSYYTQTKYCTDASYGTVDNKTQLELSDDAARANWGGSWRMPTKAEQDELHNNCTWKLTTQNGVNGYKVTSKTNGNSIFLPVAGYRNGSSLISAGSYGYYWSSSLLTGGSYGAYNMYFLWGVVSWEVSDRDGGRSVRPVCQVEGN